MNLKEFQDRFGARLLNREVTSSPPNDFLEIANNEELLARFDIYKNNVYYSLTESLKSLYPSTLKTVGVDFFSLLAREYIAQNRSSEAAMVHFGHDFVEFAAIHRQLENLPYLPDLMRLELAQHRAYHAFDQKPLLVEDFAGIPPDDLPSIRVKMNASVKLLSSPYSIYSLWEMNQADDSDTKLNIEAPQWFMVFRQEHTVFTQRIDRPMFTFLCGLDAGASFGESLESALAIETDFRAPEAVSFVISHGLAQSFTSPE